MAVRIRLLPNGKEFVSEGRSSILEAGLRAGLALGYGCSNGNCGKCVGRIVSGEVQKTRHHDFLLTADERASGHVLMCCNTAASDVVIEASEASGAQDIPLQQITARVRQVSPTNGEVALLHLKTPRTNRLRFLAGQYVQLGGNGIPAARHSIASCPCDDMNLHFQVPRLAGDAFSDVVFGSLERGDPVDISGPGGDFILDESSERPLVFVAWRTGFAPIRSLIEHAMALETAQSIHLFWLAPDPSHRFFDNLCRSWADALDDFHYVTIDLPGDVPREKLEESLPGRLDKGGFDPANFDYYIAGSPQLRQACRDVLSGAGVPAKQLELDPLNHA